MALKCHASIIVRKIIPTPKPEARFLGISRSSPAQSTTARPWSRRAPPGKLHRQHFAQDQGRRTLPLLLIQPPQELGPLPQRGAARVARQVRNLLGALLEALRPVSTTLHLERRGYVGEHVGQLVVVEDVEHAGAEGVEVGRQRAQVDGARVGLEGVGDVGGERGGEVEGDGGGIGRVPAGGRQMGAA
jgi:hypothetical protein